MGCVTSSPTGMASSKSFSVGLRFLQIFPRQLQPSEPSLTLPIELILVIANLVYHSDISGSTIRSVAATSSVFYAHAKELIWRRTYVYEGYASRMQNVCNNLAKSARKPRNLLIEIPGQHQMSVPALGIRVVQLCSQELENLTIMCPLVHYGNLSGIAFPRLTHLTQWVGLPSLRGTMRDVFPVLCSLHVFVTDPFHVNRLASLCNFFREIDTFTVTFAAPLEKKHVFRFLRRLDRPNQSDSDFDDDDEAQLPKTPARLMLIMRVSEYTLDTELRSAVADIKRREDIADLKITSFLAYSTSAACIRQGWMSNT
ncbi:hypothetical protein DL96DRAFT_1611146 [Flagelloscypha sp. PMI_526]|nr:hypothetical protein DL96DRAFT_1611146 [Flagelloscypha sp. PMI_526]